MKSEFEFEIKPQRKVSLGIHEIIENRELLYFFTWRDIKVRYKQTVLGFAWAVIQPVMMVIIFTFFFGKTLSVPSDNIPYPVFVFAGLLLWNIFSNGLSNAANSMVMNANIIKKIYFPRLIIPLSSILVTLFDFLMAFALFLGMVLWYHIPVNLVYFMSSLLFSLVLVLFGTFGPGCLLAALNVKYRDFRYVIPFLMQALLFVTPVIYPVSMIKHSWIKWVLALNPMTGAINLFRSALTGKSPDMNLILLSSVSAVFFFIIGVYYFRKTEAYFADLA
jgi:lipopolysaccharide transport system permease protein